MTPPQPFFAWPGWPHVRRALWLTLGVGLWFALVYCGSDVLTGWRSARVPVHFEWELAIPFVPAWVLGYMAVYPLFALGPFVLRRRRELDAYAAALVAVIAVGGVCFLLIPTEAAYPPEKDAGVWAPLYEFARRAALRHNLLPSLHVAQAVLSAAIFSARVGRAGRCAFTAWAAAVAASTLLTHQHHVLDVITGWLLGLAGKSLVFDRLSAAASGRASPP